MRVVLGVMVLFAALPAVSSASPVTVGFHPTGGEQAFLVPGGVRTVHVVAVGGHGGLGYLGSMGTSGGLGALVSGDVPVVPGTTLFVEVGGNGTDATGYSHPTGGFNGGGTGGYGASYSGGAGGGASDARTAPAAQADSLTSRLLIAAGGGGAGGSTLTTEGNGGGAGQPGQDGSSGAGGGGAGTASAGGSAGADVTTDTGAVPATAGSLGAGGKGGDSGGSSAGGGGGGGGLYGGGGGGTRQGGVGGGGGGGSSFTDARVTNATVNADTTGNPSVTISYEPVPTADPSPNGLAFDPQMPGTTSPSKTLTVANNGSAPLNISSVAISGANAGDFVADSACAGPVAVGSSCQIFVRFAPVVGGARSASLVITSDAPTSPTNVALTGGSAIGPNVTGLAISPSAFRAAAAGASVARAPIGATIRYSDTQAATTTFTVQQSRPGVRKKGRCVAPPRHPAAGKHPRRCHRTVSLGRFTHSDRAGLNSFRFTGRVKGAALRPGRYKLRAVPLALGLKGSARTTGFKIVK